MGDDEDMARRSEEFEALRAIYDDQLEGDVTGPWRVSLGGAAMLEVHLPLNYPSKSAPTPLIHAPLPEARLAMLASEMAEMYDGMEVVYAWAEHLREALNDVTTADRDLAADLQLALDIEAEEETADVDEQDLECPPEHAGDFTFTPQTSQYGQRVRLLSCIHACMCMH